MRRIIRVVLWGLGGLLAIVLAVTPYLFGSAAIPDTSEYRLDLPTLRRLANEPIGAKPLRVNAAVVCDAMVPAAFFRGGIRFDRQRAVFPGYQVVYPDGAVIIDAPPGRGFWIGNFPGKFSEEQFDGIQKALTGARAIVITHEHADHLGGIAQSAGLRAFAGKLKLSREQRDDVKSLSGSKFPEDIRTSLQAVDYDHYFALAPGVVLIKAPGHTPGSQMIYVHLANDSEYLLVGDVAWAMEQVTTPRCRPRLAELMMPEDSGQVTAELRTLHDFAVANKDVHLLVSHDGEQLDAYQNAGLVGRKFE